MAELNIRVPNKKLAAVKKVIQKELEKDELRNRLELVKIITRTKAPVCNWRDLEREIMKGAI